MLTKNQSTVVQSAMSFLNVTKYPDRYEQQPIGLVSFVPLVHGKKT